MDEAISFPVESIEQIKIILSAWYSFLKDEPNIEDQFTNLLKTPILYKFQEDRLEVLFCGSADLLNRFKEKFQKQLNEL